MTAARLSRGRCIAPAAFAALLGVAASAEAQAPTASALRAETSPAAARTGEHRNFVMPFPEWVDEPTAKAADGLSVDAAVGAFPRWLDARKKPKKK